MLDSVRSKTSLKGRSASTKASWRPRRTRRSPSQMIITPPQPLLKRLWVRSITTSSKGSADGARTLIWIRAWAPRRKKRRSKPWPHLSNRLFNQSSFGLLESGADAATTWYQIKRRIIFQMSELLIWFSLSLSLIIFMPTNCILHAEMIPCWSQSCGIKPCDSKSLPLGNHTQIHAA